MIETNIHSDKGTINCPKCKLSACLYHMICHFCGYQLRIADREMSS